MREQMDSEVKMAQFEAAGNDKGRTRSVPATLGVADNGPRWQINVITDE